MITRAIIQAGAVQIMEEPDQVLTPEEIAALEQAELVALKLAFEKAIDAHIDAMARTKNYGKADYLLTGSSPADAVGKYAGFDNPFRAEAETFLAWVADCWIYSINQMNLVEAGQRPMPESPEAFVTELPPLVW